MLDFFAPAAGHFGAPILQIGVQDILSPDPRNERGEEGSQPVLIPLMIPNMMDQRVQKHYVFTLISNQLKHNTKTQCF